MAVFADREWQSAGPAESHGLALRVVSYNVLAQCNIKASQFPYASAEQLSWARRSALLGDELRALNADLLLLQEVDNYEAGWRTALAALGYESRFQKRSQAGGVRGDGVCVAWRAATLELRAGRGIEHNDLATMAYAVGDGARAARLRNRDNVGLVVALAPRGAVRGAPPLLLVATTHTYWNPAFEDVKAAQAAHTLRCVAAFGADLAVAAAAAAAPGLPPPPPPLLLGGDFNALPGSPAAVMLANAGGIVEPRLGPLRSVYAGRLPAFTTATQNFTGALATWWPRAATCAWCECWRRHHAPHAASACPTLRARRTICRWWPTSCLWLDQRQSLRALRRRRRSRALPAACARRRRCTAALQHHAQCRHHSPLRS